MSMNPIDTMDLEQAGEVDVQAESEEQHLAFFTDGLCFAVPAKDISTIIMTFEITKLPKLPNYIPGVMNLRGQIVPVVDFRLRSGRPDAVYDRDACVVVLDIEEMSIGLLVEKVSHVVDIAEETIKPSSSLEQQELVKGIAQEGGEVYLILDSASLLV